MVSAERGFAVNQELSVEVLREGRMVLMAAIVSKVLPDAMWLRLFADDRDPGTLERGTHVKLKFWDAQGVGYQADTLIAARRLPGGDTLLVQRPKAVVPAQQRGFFRLDVAVPFSLVVLAAANPSVTSKTFAFMSQDLSAGGLRFESDAELSLNDRVRVTLHMPPNSDLMSDARIAWKRAASLTSGRTKLFGIEFVRMSERQRDGIFAFLFSIQRKRKTSGT